MIVEVGYFSQHHGEYVGRPQSPLGNPWSHKPTRYAEVVPTLERALALYAEWLRERLRLGALEMNRQRAEMDRLKELLRLNRAITLRCWCSQKLRPPKDPPECHADTIAKVLCEELDVSRPVFTGAGQLSLF